jgi:D-alanine-D-alanine ligase
MEKLPEGSENIATLKVKWDPNYQEKVGVATRAAELTPEQHKTLERLSKRIYRYLFLTGYARLDYRMTEDGQFYLLEANPNPQIAYREDFADSAEYSGVAYDQLLQKIMTVGMNYASARNGTTG